MLTLAISCTKYIVSNLYQCVALNSAPSHLLQLLNRLFSNLMEAANGESLYYYESCTYVELYPYQINVDAVLDTQRSRSMFGGRIFHY